MSSGPPIDARRVLADLRELERRTGGPDGARRVCWDPAWRIARDFLRELLDELALTTEIDEAGNLWATLPGVDRHAPALALGSHLDSVPAGGWLDGALGVMAAVGVLRAWVTSGSTPPRSLVLLDFADEEGARFGRSLFGSSALAGTLVSDEVAVLRDQAGFTAAEILEGNGVVVAGAPSAAERRGRLGAFIELHIEQGPVLEREGLPVAAVAGCVGVERHRCTFCGQAAHAGTTPMRTRRDAGLAAADAALRIEQVGLSRGGVTTTGRWEFSPGVPTAVPGKVELTMDLRHADEDQLAAMLAEAKEAASQTAVLRQCELRWEEIWRIEPIPFDVTLVRAAADASRRAGGSDQTLTSGALHDAAELARVMPAAMLFTSSRGGISHSKDEDTPESHLVAAIAAFGDLAADAVQRLADGEVEWQPNRRSECR
jgi:N-carbamoyl-L-amino-acid hydrolase